MGEVDRKKGKVAKEEPEGGNGDKKRNDANSSNGLSEGNRKSEAQRVTERESRDMQGWRTGEPGGRGDWP